MVWVEHGHVTVVVGVVMRPAGLCDHHGSWTSHAGLLSQTHSLVPVPGSLDRSVEGETAQIILNSSTDTSRLSQTAHSSDMALQVQLSL